MIYKFGWIRFLQGTKKVVNAFIIRIKERKKRKKRESSSVNRKKGRRSEKVKYWRETEEIRSIRIKIMSSITYIKMPTKWFINEY